MNQTTLKIIAVASMLIDHIGAVILMPMAQMGENVELYWLTRYIGRMAFPIFAYLLAVGCMHTRNIKIYALRLAVLALISQIPYDLAFGSEISFIRQTNIFYTLFLAVLAIAVYQNFQKGDKTRYWAALIALPPFAFVAFFLGTDFGAFGVALIFFLYIANPAVRLHAAAIVAAFMFYRHFTHDLWFFVFALAAAACIYFCTGKQGARQPIFKYGFYAFYPLHLAVLAAL